MGCPAPPCTGISPRGGAALCVIRGVPNTGDHPARQQQRAAAGRTPARMKADGHTGKDIGKYLGVSRAPVYRYLTEDTAA